MFKLRLNNYRGFLNEEFDFSRVNILIGENSAGKSSIFKFLLALKQSMNSSNNRDYNLTLSGEETDLGNYEETIYNHEIDRNLSFAFEFGKEYYDFFMMIFFSNFKNKERKAEVANYLAGADNAPTILSFEVCSDLSNHKNIIFTASNSNIGTLKFIFPDSDNTTEQDIYFKESSSKCELVFESKFYSSSLCIKNVEYEKQAFLSIVKGETLKDGIKMHREFGEIGVERIYWSIAYLLVAQNYIQMLLSKIEYVNPLLHRGAERVYLESDRKKTRQVKNIKDLIDFLDTTTTEKTFEIDLTKLLKNFGIAESFTIKKAGFTREFRVKVNNLENNIKDVGFGVSLQLPIFAQAIASEIASANKFFRGGTLLIEQPEVHLHPRLQAKFIETLLSIGNNNVYFIETHSEHIIRMLQVLVKTKKNDIKADDISIHYFRKEEKRIVKSNHNINSETGKLSPNFPKGFYDVSYDLAFQLID